MWFSAKTQVGRGVASQGILRLGQIGAFIRQIWLGPHWKLLQLFSSFKVIGNNFFVFLFMHLGLGGIVQGIRKLGHFGLMTQVSSSSHDKSSQDRANVSYDFIGFASLGIAFTHLGIGADSQGTRRLWHRGFIMQISPSPHAKFSHERVSLLRIGWLMSCPIGFVPFLGIQCGLGVGSQGRRRLGHMGLFIWQS